MAKIQEMIEMLTEEEEEEEEEQDQEISALLSSSIALTTDPSELSPDDISWVDSCIVSEPQISDDSWGSRIEALLETLTTQFDSDAEKPSNAFLEYKQEISDSISIPIGEKADDAVVVRKSEKWDPVQEEAKPATAGGDDNGEEDVVESYDDIFKVWELGKYEDDEDDESELIKQLKKVLMGSKSQIKSVDNEVVEVDELVAGMMNLSLKLPKE